MYTPENLLAELRSDRVSQKAVDIASILFLVTSYHYNNSEMPTVQPDNTKDMEDFSYFSFESRLRIRELPHNGTTRKIIFSYYNPVYEKHGVSSIVFGEKAQNGCLVPRDSLSYRDLQLLENDSFIPYADITDLPSTRVFSPMEAQLSSGAVVSCHTYTRDVSVSQLADVLEKMLEIGEDFYNISPTVSYIEKQYDNRLM
jgi:hypothetical protein